MSVPAHARRGLPAGAARGAAALCVVLALGCGEERDLYVGTDFGLVPDVSSGAGDGVDDGVATDGSGAQGGTDAPATGGGGAGPGAADDGLAAEPAAADDQPATPAADTGDAVIDAGTAPAAAPLCGPALADCDGDAANGCETDIRRDPDHCGACDVPCGFPDCACEDGAPVLRCPAGRDDCDGDPSNGCEVDVRTDAAHCGACSRACHADGREVFSATCEAGACVLSCHLTWADCNGDPDDGCETNTFHNDANCGACGVVCRCDDGRCI